MHILLAYIVLLLLQISQVRVAFPTSGILPYSQKYWRSLNLVVWSQTERKKILAGFKCGSFNPDCQTTKFNSPSNILTIWSMLHQECMMTSSWWDHLMHSIIDHAHCGHHTWWTGYWDSRLQTGSVPDHCPFCRQVRLTLPLSWNPGMHLYCTTAPKPAPVKCSRASSGGSKSLQPTALAEKSYNS